MIKQNINIASSSQKKLSTDSSKKDTEIKTKSENITSDKELNEDIVTKTEDATVNNATKQQTKRKKLYTPEILNDEIKIGKKALFIYENKVYNVTNFKSIHPGGPKAMERMIGQDATDEIQGFHPKYVIEKLLPKFCVGEFLNTDDITSSSNSPLAHKYRELHLNLMKQGFYEYNIWFYIRRLCFFAALLSCSIYTLFLNPASPFSIIPSAFMMGMVWHGLSFSTHDLGHNSVTGNRTVDYIWGICYASFVGGLSLSWWKDSHNVHHIVTNHPEHDPDIQHMPFLAISTQFFSNLYSTYHEKLMSFDWFTKKLVSIQNYSFIPILSFGRFNLQVQSLAFLLNFKARREYRILELSGILFYFVWFGYWLLYTHIPTIPLRLLYLYVSYASTTVLHLQITLSHFAMSTEIKEKELFLLKGLRTTMNVDCPAYMDWLHGGLQFQVEHHLFPRVPRANLRKLSVIVQQFCLENDLEYHTYPFIQGNLKVLDVLKSVANQVRFLYSSTNPDIRYKQA